MTSFYLKNAQIRANDVDFKRASKILAKVIGEMTERAVVSGTALKIDNSHALDLMAKVLGTTSYADVKKGAADLDVSNWSQPMLSSRLQDEAITLGERFPQVPPKFGKAWQAQAVEVFLEKITELNRGVAEFIAIIGKSGSGKSILVKHMVALLGGRVIDASTSIFCQPGRVYEDGELHVLDIPAETYREASSRRDPFRHEQLTPSYLTQQVSSFEAYRAQRRKLFTLDCLDNEWTSLAQWASDNPQATLVVCFPDVESAQRWMESNLVLGHKPKRNWRQAHVIDLDQMDTYTIEGRSLQTERNIAASNS